MRGWLSVLLLSLALAGCQRAKSAGPAWPAPSTTAEDGGESIEPGSTSVASSIEKSDDDEEEDTREDAPAESTDKPAASSESDKPATVSPPSQPPSDDVIISEDIIIEIDDE